MRRNTSIILVGIGIEKRPQRDGIQAIHLAPTYIAFNSWLRQLVQNNLESHYF